MRQQVIGVVMLTLVAASCSARSDARTVEVGSERIQTSQLTAALAGLCTAARRTADPVLARTIFYDRSHADLHLIARALEEIDRPTAGRLLEAKQRVEADLASRGASTLGPDLQRLIAVTRFAIGRLSVRRRTC